jgi:ribosomal protein L11 methyltransferase
VTWIQISIRIDPAHAEETGDGLEAAGAIAVTLEDAGDDPVLEPAPGETPLWRDVVATALFDLNTPGICECLLASRGWASRRGFHLSLLADRPWEREWLRDFGPMRFGERLWVCPGDRTPPADDVTVIRLDPGLAFGTGTHPTTALCLEWLDRHPPAGMSVVDFGCGSGILGIAAAKLGATRVWCVDNDEQAVVATRDNARANGVAGRLQVADPVPPLPRVDLLVSNILSGPLKALAPRFADSVAAGGTIVLSGILAGQAEEVAAVYAPWFTLEPPAERDQWIRLSGQRREND